MQNEEATKDVRLFDHKFKAAIHTTSGPVITRVFGSCSGANRPIQLVCSGPSLNIIEKSAASKTATQADLDYAQVGAQVHSNVFFIALTRHFTHRLLA